MFIWVMDALNELRNQANMFAASGEDMLVWATEP